MRKLLLVVIVMGLALTLAPARAEVRTISTATFSFHAAMPCHLLCNYGDLSAGDDNACNDPWPPGTYADRVIRVPKTANFLILYAYPELDWDVFLCRGGQVVRWSAGGAGDTEKVATYVKPGATYRVRAYNWADVNDLPAKLTLKYVR